ncbi:MAG: hypothetical protein ACPGUZ_01565 [Holosporaceae bacterium]
MKGKQDGLRGKMSEQRMRFFKDLLHCLLLNGLLLGWWFLGHKWSTWPLWILCGTALAFVVRAASEGVFLPATRVQGWLSKTLGAFEEKQIKNLERLFVRYVSTEKKRPSSENTEEVKEEVKAPVKRAQKPAPSKTSAKKTSAKKR